ncbi:hypothetical protein AB4Y44_42195, partial [Paraburkholderia sp. BR10937]|uniref:hypothetical protein n=1 Tax=Paraburkholderia sp. BR10937 TaxID=3236994 RepID=UPI0034D27E94
LGKRRSSCFKSRTTNLLADSAADTPNVKKDRRSENVLCRPSLASKIVPPNGKVTDANQGNAVCGVRRLGWLWCK